MSNLFRACEANHSPSLVPSLYLFLARCCGSHHVLWASGSWQEQGPDVQICLALLQKEHFGLSCSSPSFQATGLGHMSFLEPPMWRFWNYRTEGIIGRTLVPSLSATSGSPRHRLLGPSCAKEWIQRLTKAWFFYLFIPWLVSKSIWDIIS